MHSAKSFNSGDGQGWFFPWLGSSAIVASGWPDGRAITGQSHREFLSGFCGKYPGACRSFGEKSHQIFVTYPLVSGGVTMGLFLFLMVAVGMKKRDDEEHRRGSRIVEAKQLAQSLRKERASIFFGGVPFPFADENRHLLLAGAPGSGKSVAIQTLLAAIRARGDRAIVVDLGGAYTARFARRGDVLLNPFDARTAGWSPFAEGAQPYEIEAMARSLVPSGEGSDKIWADLAKTVMAGLLEQCQHHRIATNHHLAGLATCGDPDLLAKILEGHPAHALISSDSKQTVGSILTNLGERGAGLRYLNPEAGAGGFSVGKWVQGGSGWLFLGLQIGQREALKHIVAAQIDAACRAVLDLPESEKRRIWLIVDELPLLGKVNSIVEFLTNARKNGGASVLGVQALSQLREIYGRDTATTMLSCLGSQLILRTPDPETADYMSKILGEKEVTRRNKSTGKTEQGISKNESEQVANSRVVMPAEIQNLPNLVGFLNLIGDRPTARVKLEIPPTKSVNPAFMPREMPPRRPLAIPPHLFAKDTAAPVAAAPAPQNKPEPVASKADGDWMNQLDKE